jgi:hypothetical protein
MKKLFYISLILTISLFSCNSEKTQEVSYIQAGFGQSNDHLLVSDDTLGEDILMGQLPMKVVLKIEKNRKLRYMQLTNVIKYIQESPDSIIIYDLTFESLSDTSQRKSVLFDENGNKIYKSNHNLN